MKQYYEVHITFLAHYLSKRTAKLVCSVEAPSWTFSAIDGDIILGDGVKCYLTKHYNQRVSIEDITKELNTTAELISRTAIKVIRKKIELVIYDERLK